ncbi:MAG: tetratricopeptide repeat protein [Anaerolineae bacterium]
MAKQMTLRQRAGQHLDRAERLERSGRLDEAMAELKSALEIDPNMPEAQIALGYHFRRKGLLVKAADAFRRAASLGDDYEGVFNLGHVLIDLRRFDEAAQAFRRCLTYWPGDPEAHYELAYALYSAGHWQEALSELDALLVDYPDDWELVFLRGSCLMLGSDYARAEEDFRRSLASAPDEDAAMMLQENLESALRHQEFPAGASLNAKDRMYADFGVVCLGSAADDGLSVPEYPVYNFQYPDVARTLKRFIALCDALDLDLTAVVAADLAAVPLAIVLGQALGLAVVPLAAVAENDLPLVVAGVCSGPELYDLILEHLPNDSVSFALAIDWSGRTEFVTDVVGVATNRPSTMPWTVGSSADSPADVNEGRIILTTVTQIVQHLAILATEANQGQQTSYYADWHRRLRLPLMDPVESESS